MTTSSNVAPSTLEAIRRFDTCTIANAIETFQIRLKNEGYTGQGLHCVTGGFPRVLGYAATFRMRSADPPLTGGSYWDRTDWWQEIERLPSPRVAVIHNPESHGAGAMLGGVHAAVLRAFGCLGVITDGTVRDVEESVRVGFPMFARGLAVSHAYTHIVEFGGPVKVFGLEIAQGDLVYADCHGALSIPVQIVDRIPAAAEQIHAKDQRIIELCRSREFSRDRLRQAIQNRS